MKYGSLFSGAGLGDFGFEMAGLELVWQVENNEYCQKILNLRWPNVKKYKDIKEVKGTKLERVDLITGGFPCQPFSVAGKQDGADDDRNLWPEMFRIIKEIRPRWVVAENVPGIIPIYIDVVLADLESQEYTCWPVVFSSHSLGAWHKRERLWVIAESSSDGLNRSKLREFREHNDTPQTGKENAAETSGHKTLGEIQVMADSGLLRQTINEKQTTGVEQYCENVADSNTKRSQRSRAEEHPQGRKKQSERQIRLCDIFKRWWSTEPAVGRVVNGCPNRVDRLKALGNGQTPCSTYVIGKWIKEIENQ